MGLSPLKSRPLPAPLRGVPSLSAYAPGVLPPRKGGSTGLAFSERIVAFQVPLRLCRRSGSDGEWERWERRKQAAPPALRARASLLSRGSRRPTPHGVLRPARPYSGSEASSLPGLARTSRPTEGFFVVYLPRGHSPTSVCFWGRLGLPAKWLRLASRSHEG